MRASNVASGNGRSLALAEDERDAIVEAGRGDVPSAAAQHVLAQVDADDPSLGPVGQIEGDTRRARGHVEHRGRAVVATWSIISRRHRRSWPSESTAARRS